MGNVVKVEDIIFEENKYLKLVQITKDVGYKRKILSNQVYNFSNYLLVKTRKKLSIENQIVLISKYDMDFLNQLSDDERKSIFTDLLDSNKISCVVIADNETLKNEIVNIFNNKNVAVLKSGFNATEITYKLAIFLSNKLSPNVVIHGVLTEVYGMGILLLGKSGIGKSETALELIERGHRLIADDIVEITLAGNALIGKGSEHIKYHMEIRGLGIINIKSLYGIGSIKNTTKIDAVIEFEEWDSNKEYDRLGLDDKVQRILGIEVPKYLIPVRIGRNLAIIIEVAAKNQRLKQMGTFSAQEFNKKLMGWIQRNENMLV